MIKWLPRKDGTVPMESILDASTLKEHSPKILIEYYENQMKWFSIEIKCSIIKIMQINCLLKVSQNFFYAFFLCFQGFKKYLSFLLLQGARKDRLGRLGTEADALKENIWWFRICWLCCPLDRRRYRSCSSRWSPGWKWGNHNPQLWWCPEPMCLLSISRSSSKWEFWVSCLRVQFRGAAEKKKIPWHCWTCMFDQRFRIFLLFGITRCLSHKVNQFFLGYWSRQLRGGLSYLFQNPV